MMCPNLNQIVQQTRTMGLYYEYSIRTNHVSII